MDSPLTPTRLLPPPNPNPMSDAPSPTPTPNGLPSSTPKRHRRPSVRLGDIGDQPASAIPHLSYIRRCHQLNVPVPSHYPSSSSKTRSLPLPPSPKKLRTDSPDPPDWGDDEDVRSDGVRAWLEGIGLGKYAGVFEIHEVDEDVLPWLTLEDLREMGICAVGSRRKLFCAIQRLRNDDGSGPPDGWIGMSDALGGSC